MNRRGFTLIEILVAIAIVGVIFGIIISSAAGIQRAGRNAQRKTDLRTMQAALQQYYADQQKFPLTITSGSPIENSDGSRKYLKSVPTDPQGVNYNYSPLTNHSSGVACTETSVCNYYTLCIAAELPASDLNEADCGAGKFGVTPL